MSFIAGKEVPGSITSLIILVGAEDGRISKEVLIFGVSSLAYYTQTTLDVFIMVRSRFEDRIRGENLERLRPFG